MSLSSKINYALEALSGITVSNINITGSIFQNNNPYIASQWTSTSGNTLTYTSGNVIISSGTLYANGGTIGILYANTITVPSLLATTSVSSGALYSTNATSTNIVATTLSSGTASFTSGITTATLLATTSISSGILNATNTTVTNAVHTTLSSGNMNITTSLRAPGNSNTLGNIITTGGNIGVGTTIPIATLDFGAGGGSKKIGLAVQAPNFWGLGAANSAIEYQVPSGSEHRFYIDSTTTTLGTERMRISTSGNVGIGTTSPSSSLHVNGAITHGGGYAVYGLSVSSYPVGDTLLSFGTTQFSSRITNNTTFFTFQDAGIFMIHVKLNSDTIITANIQLDCAYWTGTDWVTYQQAEDSRSYNNQVDLSVHFMVQASANQAWAIIFRNDSGGNWAFAPGFNWSRVMIYKVA